jgi:predicted ATPase
MITKLRIGNFKSWHHTGALRFAPLTCFFGSNSSGKTSILQLLLMLKQTVESPDRKQVLNLGDDRSLVSLGTFRDVVFGHGPGRKLFWNLEWQLAKDLQIADPERQGSILFSGREMRFDALLTEQGDEGLLAVDHFLYMLGDSIFLMTRKSNKSDKYDLDVVGPDTFKLRRTRGRKWDLPAPIKCYGFPDQVKAYYQNAGFLSDLELAFEQLFSGVFYLGPLREYPKRQYPWAGAQPADVGYRGEKAVEAILASRQRGEKISRGRGHKKLTVEQYVAQWLQDLGLIHDFTVSAVTKGSNLYQVKVRRTPGAAEVLITDVGFGVSQLLPVLVLCYYAPEGSTLILEQPEIHLHPSVQAGLADVFIDAIRTRNIQIVLESHSEYLVKRLQRRIAEEEGGITNDDVALYFCSMAEKESTIEPLDIDQDGNIRNWPADFFGDEMGDIAARTRAAMNRKRLAG